jgi:hypothetical protein
MPKTTTAPKPIPVEYQNPNKIKVTTGHKTFDRFCNYLGTGNVVSDGQWGSFIRPETETECNGMVWKPGELRDFDLKPYRESLRMPAHIDRRVLAATETEDAILSAIFHYNGDKRIVHGYILTKNSSGNHKLLWAISTGRSYRSQHVLDWCAQRISTP